MRYGIMFRVPGRGVVSSWSLLTAPTRAEAERRANGLNSVRDRAMRATGAVWFVAPLSECRLRAMIGDGSQ